MTRLIASVENSAGKSATAKTNTNGTFTVTVEKGSPYLIKVKSGDKVVANLKALLLAKGFSEAEANALDIFAKAFVASNSTIAGDKLDNTLDAFQFAANCSVMACAPKYIVKGATYTGMSTLIPQLSILVVQLAVRATTN